MLVDAVCSSLLKTIRNEVAVEHAFLRVRCAGCHAERLVAFSCKRRGFYPGQPALRVFTIAPGNFLRELRRAPDG
ncbi:MAG: hypothetical protein EXR83_04920 [Gammaproteobacteria bacterium]|nr:hypothetical protein [Gammaproteobacteria bacterium]